MTNTTTTITREAMRHAAREAIVADLREGRKQRSTRIESAKGYRRHPKHRNGGQD